MPERVGVRNAERERYNIQIWHHRRDGKKDPYSRSWRFTGEELNGGGADKGMGESRWHLYG